jgi:proliferating cell nuclear antigen PCNA
MSNKNMMFHLKTRDGFVFKIFSEFFSSCMMRCAFNIDKNGLSMLSTDNKNHRLFSVMMPRLKFRNFTFTKPFTFDVNSNHLHKIMKTIRKKDSLTMYITEESPHELNISVSQGLENIESTSTIRIMYVHPANIDIIDYSEKSYVNCTGKDFQKIKNLSNIGKKTNVILNKRDILFECDGSDVISKSIKIGEDNEHNNDKNNEQVKVSIQTVYISSLSKIASISSNVLIYICENSPVKITFDIPTVGDFNVFVKTEKMITEEDKQNSDNDTNEDNEKY